MQKIEDKEFTCVDCGTLCIWTAGEQSFLHGLVADGKIEKVIPPKRCKECREAKKSSKILNKTDNIRIIH